jgi:hypothetical protein
MRTIASDGEVSRNQMCQRTKNHFDPFLLRYAQEVDQAYKGKTLETLNGAEFTAKVFEHYAAYLEDNINKFHTARNYFSAAKVYVERKFPAGTAAYAAVRSTECSDWQKKIQKFFSGQCAADRTQ